MWLSLHEWIPFGKEYFPLLFILLRRPLFVLVNLYIAKQFVLCTCLVLWTRVVFEHSRLARENLRNSGNAPRGFALSVIRVILREFNEKKRLFCTLFFVLTTILNCHHSDESFWAVLSCGKIYRVWQRWFWLQGPWMVCLSLTWFKLNLLWCTSLWHCFFSNGCVRKIVLIALYEFRKG